MNEFSEARPFQTSLCDGYSTSALSVLLLVRTLASTFPPTLAVLAP